MKRQLTDDEERFIENIFVSYNEALERYGRKCVSYKNHLYSCVEDALQLTFLKAIDHVDTLMKHENVIGWLKESYYHELQHTLRRVISRHEVMTEDPDQLKAVHQERMKQAMSLWQETVSVKDTITTACETLSEEEYVIFMEHFLNNSTIEQTAKMMNASHDSIRGKIRTIRKKLKKNLFLVCCFLILLDYIG